MSFEDPYNALDRRKPDPMIEMISHKVSRIELSMDKLTEAITKLAVVEEKQAAASAALERAFMAIQKSDERCQLTFEKTVAKLEKVENRVDALEAAAPMQAQTSQWVNNAIWAAAALAGSVVVHKLGLLG